MHWVHFTLTLSILLSHFVSLEEIYHDFQQAKRNTENLVKIFPNNPFYLPCFIYYYCRTTMLPGIERQSTIDNQGKSEILKLLLQRNLFMLHRAFATPLSIPFDTIMTELPNSLQFLHNFLQSTYQLDLSFTYFSIFENPTLYLDSLSPTKILTDPMANLLIAFFNYYSHPPASKLDDTNIKYFVDFLLVDNFESHRLQDLDVPKQECDISVLGRIWQLEHLALFLIYQASPRHHCAFQKNFIPMLDRFRQQDIHDFLHLPENWPILVKVAMRHAPRCRDLEKPIKTDLISQDELPQYDAILQHLLMNALISQEMYLKNSMSGHQRLIYPKLNSIHAFHFIDIFALQSELKNCRRGLCHLIGPYSGNYCIMDSGSLEVSIISSIDGLLTQIEQYVRNFSFTFTVCKESFVVPLQIFSTFFMNFFRRFLNADPSFGVSFFIYSSKLTTEEALNLNYPKPLLCPLLAPAQLLLKDHELWLFCHFQLKYKSTFVGYYVAGYLEMVDYFELSSISSLSPVSSIFYIYNVYRKGDLTNLCALDDLNLLEKRMTATAFSTHIKMLRIALDDVKGKRIVKLVKSLENPSFILFLKGYYAISLTSLFIFNSSLRRSYCITILASLHAIHA
jgi:hypothetical protein